jgi:hypothetical protein
MSTPYTSRHQGARCSMTRPVPQPTSRTVASGTRKGRSASASYPFAYYWPERPTFVPTTVGTAVLFQMEYPGRSDLVLVRRLRQPDLIRSAVREAAARSGSGRVWLVAAEAGDRDPTWSQAMDDLGRIARRRLPRLMVVDHHGADAQVPSTRQMEIGIGTTTALDGRVR